MKKISLSFVTIILVVVFQMFSMKLKATNIDEDTARKYSMYYLSVMSGSKEANASDVILAYKFMNDSLNIPAAYVFNIEGQGFVIISGSDLWYPILGYSTEGMFDIDRAPSALKWYFEGLCKYISYSQNTNRVLIMDVKKEWEDLQYKTLPAVSTPKNSEWLLDCTWGQGDIINPTYNKFCPYLDYIDGFRETTITGCVATAMSQIMYYWKYPEEPIESTLYYPNCMIDDTVLFGDIAIDMSSVTYNFDTMPTQLTSTSTTAEIDAVALLCYHAGVSVKMNYGLYGSGAKSLYVPTALSDVFLYDTTVRQDTRVYYFMDGTQEINYTNDEWISMLSNEIAANRPVYYSGCDMDSNGYFINGHAFVCDGHHATDSNKFHFNWGWNGGLNMWCDVRNNEIGDDLYFGYRQGMVRYIKPRSEPTCDDPVLGSIDTEYDCATVTWTGGAINYQILYKEVSATTWSDTCVSSRHHYTITNLLPQTDYMMKIRALCHSEVGHSAWVDTTFSTTAYACYPPKNIKVSTEGSHEGFNVSWTSRASQWIVKIDTDQFTYIDTIDWNPVSYFDLIEGTVCSVTIKSICGENDLSEWSDTVTFIVGRHPEVTNIETIMPYCESAFFTWEGNAINYQLMYKEVSATTWSDTINTSNNFYTITGLVPETNYMIKIRALYNSSVGYSVWSNDTIFTTEAFMCNVPTDVVAMEPSYESVDINWLSDGDASRWIVRISNDTQKHIDTVDHMPVTIDGLIAGTEYYVAVRSLCYADEMSDWSDSIMFTTLLCSEVTDIVASGITSNTAVITWNSPDAVKWELNVGVGIEPGEGDIYELNERNFTITGLDPSTVYDVYVRMYCTERSYGEWSEKITFVTGREEDPEGIDGIDGNFDFEIYPNPTQGSATIMLNGVEGKVEISVVDINGRIVTNEVIECGEECVKTLDVVSLESGAYFVKVIGNTINSVRKLIVK